jgi:uncharacterized protein (TIGR02646 family)
MKKINKEKEPAAWTIYRQTPGAHYEAIPELRKALLEEQGHICAYCMRRISVDGNAGRIEHIKCRSRYADLELDYRNMVICCSGNIAGNPHCDRSKDDSDISFNPFDPNLENSISYGTKDGLIKSDNPNWDRELNEVLNLNHIRLKQNRRQVIEGIHVILKKKNWTKPQIKSELSKWESFDEEHKLKPYCGVTIWYLKRKLKRQ